MEQQTAEMIANSLEKIAKALDSMPIPEMLSELARLNKTLDNLSEGEEGRRMISVKSYGEE